MPTSTIQGRFPTSIKTATGAPSIPPMPPWTCAGIMLRDSAHIQEQEAEWEKPQGPAQRRPHGGTGLHGGEMPRRSCSSSCPALTAAGRPSSRMRAARSKCCSPDVGHLLGSASISIRVTEPERQPEVIVFSGDIGNTHQPLIKERSARLSIWSWNPPTATAATARGRTIWAS